jgi:hypothetical protein
MAKLTKTEATWSKPFLHDLFEAGGLLKRPVRTHSVNHISERKYFEQAKAICDEIKYRAFDFPKLDSAFRTLSSITYVEPLHDDGKGGYKLLDAAQMASIIAAFCAEQEIFWDDINTHRSTTEMDTYRMSILGKACWEFGCFLSQRPTKKAGATTKTRATRTPRTAGTAPKSGYKSSGPRSGEIMGLFGEPGDKSMFSRSDVLMVIVCESSKPKTQYVYVDPLTYKADPNMARLGDPSGYSACKLFFESIADAQDAIDIIKTEYTIPDHISGFTIKKQAADPNGYFKIRTNLGPAYIKASKLNEEITEEMTEETKAGHTAKFPAINDVEVYSEAMHSYE